VTESLPTERELQALKILWDRRQATVREICDAMNEEGEALAYTTVLSLLQVMEQKGLVSHKRRGKAYAYFPKVERSRTFRNLAAGFLDRVFDGAVDEYLLHALRSQRTSLEELDQLERMIADEKGHVSKGSRKGYQE
jgi:predicted transcriptional regulator